MELESMCFLLYILTTYSKQKMKKKTSYICVHNCNMHKVYTVIQLVPILPELPTSTHICHYLYDYLSSFNVYVGTRVNV